MRRALVAGVLVALAVVASTVGSSRPTAQAARDPRQTQALVEQLQKIPVGSRIRVQLVDGQKLEGQLLEATGSSVRLLLRKGDPAERVVSLDQVMRVRRLRDGSIAGKIVLWTAVGVLALFGIALAACAAG
jgi:hypothetical protein